MTVAELIEELGRYPPGMRVMTCYDAHGKLYGQVPTMKPASVAGHDDGEGCQLDSEKLEPIRCEEKPKVLVIN